MRGMHYGSHGSYSKGSEMKSGSGKSSGKQVKAGRGTIRTPFSRAILRDIGRRR